MSQGPEIPAPSTPAIEFTTVERNVRIKQESMPFHLVHFGRYGQAIWMHMKNFPELFGIPEEELLERLAARGWRPRIQLANIRRRLWKEVMRLLNEGGVQDLKGQIDWQKVTKCWTDEAIERFFLLPENTAYFLCAPPNYADSAEELLNFSLNKMLEILQQPVKKPNGEMDISMMRIQTKIVDMLGKQVFGQLIKQETRELKITATADEARQLMSNRPKDVKELEAELRALETTGRELESE